MKHAGVPMTRRYQRWTAEEDAQLLHLYEVENKFFREIDVILQKPQGAAGDRYKLLMRDRGKAPVKPPNKTSRTMLRDAIRAHETDRITAGHASITAMVLGDPLPGRSALDQKRMGVSP